MLCLGPMPSIDLFRSPGTRFLSGVCISCLVLAACVTPPRADVADPATLSGTVTYLPRIALPPDAVVHVRLEDVSLADAPATTLAEQTIPTQGRQVPIPFTLEYDPGRLEPGHRYAVRAEIRSPGDGLLWTTDTLHPVLTAGAPLDRVEIRVVQTTAPIGPGEMGSLVGPEWRLVRIETPGGDPVAPEADEPYTITFGTDGRYSGQADCNRYGGE